MKKRLLSLFSVSLVLALSFSQLAGFGVNAYDETSSSGAQAEIQETETSEEKPGTRSNYATDFEADLNEILLGGVSNVAGDPVTIQSGGSVNAMLAFTIKALDGSIEKGKIAVRVKMLKSVDIQSPSGLNEYVIGSATDPYGEIDDTDPYQYLWIIYALDADSADTMTMTYKVTPFLNGVTDDETVSEMEASVYNLNTMEVVSQIRTNKVIANTDQFNWNNATITKSHGTLTTNPSNYVIPNIRYDISTSSKTTSLTEGVGFAERVTFETEFKLPMDSSPNDEVPLVVLDKSNLTYIDGSPIPAENIDLITNSSGAVTGFVIRETVVNPDPSKEFATPKFSFLVSGATVNSAAPSIAAINSNAAAGSLAMNISQVNSNNLVVSHVKLDDEKFTENKIVIGQNIVANATITYSKGAEETGSESYKAPKKLVSSINGTAINQTDPTSTSGFVGDTIIYELGAEHFKNNQTSDFKLLQYKEVEGVAEGFDINQILPTTLGFGSVKNFTSGTITAKVEYTSGSPLVITYGPGDTLSEVVIPESDRAKVKSITYSYENVNSGFEIVSGPSIKYRILNQHDLNANGKRVTNTVQMVYDSGFGTSEVKEATASASFRYQLYPTNSSGMFSNDKYGVNLATGTQTLPKANDVVMFIIKLENLDNGVMLINGIEDQYTSEYLEAYSGDKTTVNGSTDIDARYLSSNDMNVQFWTSDPRLSTSTPTALSGISIMDDTNGNMTFDFGTTISVPADTSYYITYTMSVKSAMTANSTLGNTFVSYYNSNPVADGLFFWGPATGGGSNRSSKTHYNVSGYSKENNTAVTSIKPYASDVVLFKLTILNPTDTDWDGTVSPIIVTDTYNENYVSHHGSGNINPTLVSGLGFTLDYTKPLNLSYNASGTNVGNFDPDQMTISVNDANRKITIDLGDTVIEAGKKIELVYTLRVSSTVKAKDTLVNEFMIDYDDETVAAGSDTWEANVSQNSVGLINIAKSAAATATNGNTNTRLMNGDVIEYTVTLQNFHIRANQEAFVKNFTDTLPSNLFYVPGSAQFKYVAIKGGVTEELALPAGVSGAMVTATDSQIDVKFSSPVSLVSPSYNGAFNEVTTYKLIMTYQLAVNTVSPEVGAGVASKLQTNQIYAYFTNPQSELYYATESNGNVTYTKPVDLDSADGDGDAATPTRFGATANVTVINDQNNFVSLSKTVDIPIYNIDTHTNGRNYTITLTNTGRNDFDLSKYVDILPLYETIVPGSLYVVDADGNTINPQVSTDVYTSPSGDKYQRITVTDPLTIKAPVLASETSKVTRIFYKTTVDVAKLRTLMIESQTNSVTGQVNRFAFYVPEDTLVYGVTPFTDDQPDSDMDWDSDASTVRRYPVSYAVSYTSNQIAPVVNITTQMIYKSSGGVENYTNYSSTTDFVNPNDNIAYYIQFGNTNISNTNIIDAGSRIVLILPEGLTFLGYDFDGSNTEKTYEFLDAYEITRDSKGNQVITWTVNQALNPNVIKDFRVRVHTENYKFTTYRPEVLFVPNQSENQEFYDTPLSASTAYKNYGYTIQHKNISEWLSDLQSESHYVSDSQFVDVYGMLGVSAQQFEKDTVANTTVTSRDIDTELVLSDKGNQIEYKLNVSSVKTETTIEELSIINRLPSVGDLTNTGTRERGSEANVRLIGDGNIRVYLKETESSSEILLTPDQYTVYYFFGDPNEPFTKSDYTSGSVSGRWISKEDPEAVDILDWSTATAFKVKFDSTVKIGGLGSTNVVFDALLSDYYVGGLQARNSFGYSAKIGAGKFELLTEVLPVEVSADILLDRVEIVKNLLETDTNPLKKTFKFELTGYDESGILQYTHPELIEVTVEHDDDLGWTGSTWAYELPFGLEYRVTEVAEPNFATPVVTLSSEKFSDTTTAWQFTFNNTRVKQAFMVEKSWVDVNNALLDASSFTDITVNLVDQEAPSVVLASVTLNNDNNWTASLGEFNLYKEERDAFGALVPIAYEIQEVSVAGYTSSWTLDETTHTFNLENMEIPGSVVLEKTDALDPDKLLEGAVFELYNTSSGMKVGTTYSTDASGLITVNNLPSGTYYFKEIVAPEGYELDASHHAFTITVNQQSPVTVRVGNEMTPGDVTLIKSNIHDEGLEGVVFGLYDMNDTLIDEYTTNASGVIEIKDLSVGHYYFKEIRALAGYDIDTDSHEFEIEFNQQDAAIVRVVNQMTPGSVLLLKSNIHQEFLPNAVFELYDAADMRIGEYTTDANGAIEISELPVGAYYFVEKAAPSGYNLDLHHYAFNIDFNQQTAAIVRVVNQMTPGSVVLNKVNSSHTGLGGAVFGLYGEDGALIHEYTTDAMGMISVDALEVGNYYFKEHRAPNGYVLDETPIQFSIEFNQETVLQLTMLNNAAPILPATGVKSNLLAQCLLIAAGILILVSVNERNKRSRKAKKYEFKN